jgi:O-methyltransferase involved in polyketide biosynthesis
LTGVTQYVTQGAVQQTMRDVAGLAPCTTYVATFVVPLDAVDPADRDLVSLTIGRNTARGTPWLSTFTPGQFARLAQEPGLHHVTVISTDALTDRHFSGRSDPLRPSSAEQILIASA